jgi:hypothetical protein
MNGNPSQLACYRPSGVAPLAGTAATLLTGCAAGVLLGAVYAFLNHHDPLAYLNIVLLLLWSYLTGSITAKGIRKFHIRSVAAAAVTGVLVLAVTYSVHWFVYIATVIADIETDTPFDVVAIGKFAIYLMRHPETAWEWIRAFNSEGVWTLSSGSSRNGSAVKGVLLSAIWAAEAVVLCYMSVKIPVDEAGKPYSERLGKWMEARPLPIAIAFIEDVNRFKNAVAHGDYSALTTPFLVGAEDDAAEDLKKSVIKYAVAVLYPDPSEPYISVENVTVVKVKKSKDSVSSKNVVRYLKISPTTAQSITEALAQNL